MLNFIATIYGRETPADETVWHQWSTFLPVRGVDGQWLIGDVWRKRVPLGWLYQPRVETDQDLYDSQW